MASSPDTVASSTPTTTASNSTTGQSRPSAVTSSNVFVIKALDKIETAKETRRNKALKEAVLNAQSKLSNAYTRVYLGTHS
jgi:brefeldin A-inhibited guanine nucleotide-exchange protein